MVQRKDTPAARAALAKRRQRAAQNLNSNLNHNSLAGNGGNAPSTASAASVSTAEDTNPRSINNTESKNNNPMGAAGQASIGRNVTPRLPVKEVVSAPSSHWKSNISKRSLSPRGATSETLHTTRKVFDSHDDGADDSEHTDSRKEEAIHKSIGGGHTVAGQTLDGTITTAALTMSTAGRNKHSQEEKSHHEYMARRNQHEDAPLNKSKSFGTAAEESFVGEANIETVLRKDRSGFEYVQEVEVRQHRRRQYHPEENKAEKIQDRYEPISNFGYVEVTSPQPKSDQERRSDLMKPYYPQPKSPDSVQQQQSMIARLDTRSKEPTRPQHNHPFSGQSKQQQRQQRNETVSPTAAQRTSSNASSRQNQSSASSAETSNHLHVPSLDNSNPAIRTHVPTDDGNKGAQNVPKNDTVNLSRKQQSEDKYADSSNADKDSDPSEMTKKDSPREKPTIFAERPFQRPPPHSPRSKDVMQTHPAIEKATSLKTAPSAASSTTSFDRLTISTGGIAVIRKSRIPSPKPINPSGKRPLPQQSASSPKRHVSPGKQLSPNRPTLPPSGRHSSPPKQVLRRPQKTTHASSIAASVASENNQKSSAQTLPIGSLKPRPISSFLAKRKMASDSTVSSRPDTSVNPAGTVHSHSKTASYPSERTSSHSSQQSPRVDRLSTFLNNALNVKDTKHSHHPQAQLSKIERPDLVLQSRTEVDSYDEGSVEMKTTAIQRSIVSSSYRINYENDAADENLDDRVMSWSASKRQAISPIEQFRAAADQYDFEQKHRRQQETSFEQQGTKDQHQYQFRHLADDKAFESTTPETSKSHRPRNSFESPQQAKTGDIGQDRFQTPHNASPDQGRQLQSPAALDDQCLLKDNGVCTIDAASIHSSNNVVLRSCLTGTTVQVFQSDALASIQGLDLGLEQELLEVVKVQSEGSSHADGLRYGDVVIFRSSIARGKALGTRKRRRDIRGVDELGFFDVGSIKSDRWVILPSRFDKKIVIGRASLSTKNSLQHTNDSNRGLVQSGAPIVLRNCYNGGVLSIREGKLTLLTDSYDSSTFADLEDSTLLGRLQHHDKLCPSISESFQLLLPCVPPCPSWSPANGIGERLFSSSTFLQQSERNQSMMETIQAVTNLSTQMKEKILIDEVVGSFLGLEGVHIRFSSDNGNGVKEQAFHLIDAGGIVFDLSLRRLVEQILSLSSSYERVKHFVASHYPGYEYGRVMHALCEGLDSYLDLFASFVSDLERKVRNRKGSLTMKSIHYEITPLLHSMSILENVTEALSETNGGKLINTLCSLEKRVYMGDTVAKDLIGTLLDRCSAPYLDMLTNWLQSGMLYDTYDEFMVFQPHLPKVQTHFDGDSWSSLFQLRESHVVKDVFRNEKTIQKIVVTGKYWNAIQACNVNVKSLQETNMALPKIKTLGFHSDSSTILSYVDTTYYCASKNLISLLKGKFKLMDSLQTMKRYFLLDQGDFFMHFLDITENELMKPFENVSLGRVQHSLSMSVQSTEAQRDGDIEASSHFLQEDDRQLDPNALRCRFQGESLVAYLDSLYGGIDDLEPKTPSRQAYGASNGGDTGFDLFTIDFAQIPFPTSLVLSGHAMDSYKLLFRQLFLSKHVERRLVGVWSDHQVLKKLDSLRGLLGPTFLLRQRMLHFVQNLNNYMTFEVVESNWLEMMSAINDPETSHEQTVDAILEVHDTFLGKTLDACLLTNPFLIKSLTKLLKTCLLFTDQMKRFMDTTKIYDDSVNLAAEKRVAVQRNLNERGSQQIAAMDKKKLRRALNLVKEERAMLHHRQIRRVGREICSDSYKRMVRRFEEVFSADLALFMMQLNAQNASGMVANLGLRLDWNGFITSSISSY